MTLKFVEVAITVFVILISLSLHEAAHAYAAKALGDDTAQRAGRLSLNPFAHIDLVGTIVIPLVLRYLTGIMFGWAKPVPVNPYKLRSPRWGYVLVSFAGPAANLILSALSVVILVSAEPYLVQAKYSTLVELLYAVAVSNVFLAIFNMIPIPPLDGSALLGAMLPPRFHTIYYRYLAPYGTLILFALLYLKAFEWLKYIALGYLSLVEHGVRTLLS